jgi:hypothetical protein
MMELNTHCINHHKKKLVAEGSKSLAIQDYKKLSHPTYLDIYRKNADNIKR